MIFFYCRYETTNGIKARQTSYMVGNDRVVTGYYSYIGPDGKTYTVNYIADRNGYRATGSHLPVQPGIQPAIAVQPLSPPDPGSYPSSTPFPPFGSSTPFPSSPFPSSTIAPPPYSSRPPFPPSPFPPSPSPPSYYPPAQRPNYLPPQSYVPSTTIVPPPYYSPSSTEFTPTVRPFPTFSPSSPTYLPPLPSSTYIPSTTTPFPIYTGPSPPWAGYVYQNPYARQDQRPNIGVPFSRQFYSTTPGMLKLF